MSDASSLPSQQVLTWVDRQRWWLFAGVLILYIAGFNGQWRIGSDSAVHVAIAHSLQSGKGFVHPTGRESEVNHGLAYTLACSFQMGGDHGMLVAQVVLWLVALLGLGLTYTLFQLHADRPTAVLVTVLMGVTETYFRYAYFVLTDVPFTIGGLLTLIGMELLIQRATTGRCVAGAAILVAGIAVMAVLRSVIATYLLAILAAGIWWAVASGGKRRWIMLLSIGVVGAGAIAGMWLAIGGTAQDELTIVRSFTTQLPQTLSRALTTNLAKLVGEVAAEAVTGIDWGWVVATPISVFILIGGVMLVRRRLVWGMLVAAFTLQWLLFIVTERYFLPILPLLVFAWWRTSVWLSQRVRDPNRQGWVLLVMLVLLAVPNTIRTIGFVLEQRQTPFFAHYMDGRYEPIQRIAAWLKQNTPEGTVVVLTETRTSEMVALSQRVAVPFRRLAEFGDGAPMVVLVEPIEDRALKQLERRGWAAGDVLWTYEDATGVTWTVRRLGQSAKPQALLGAEDGGEAQ